MSRNVYLFQPEITSGPINEHYLPYTVGCIWAYCEQFSEIQQNYELKEVIWKRERQKDVLDRLENPEVCAFSTYVWNENWNLTCARKIKELWPECLIVFGGPSVNKKWSEHDFIDVAMFGEGEEKWAELLHKNLNNEALKRYWNNPRQNDIADYPSPYTTGFFDKIINDNPDAMWFMMLETNRGCPYHCTFCGWGAAYLNKLKTFAYERVAADIEWAITNNIHWIFPIDANSGILKERDIEIAKLIRQAILDERSKISRVTFNHAKNLNEACFEMERIIQEWTYGLEVAVQSMHQPTLTAVKRDNMGMNNLERTFALSKKYGIKFYTEMVLGLPLETKETYIDGIFKLIRAGQHDNIKTYLTTVIPNSEMDDVNYQEKYGIELIYPKDMYRAPEERIWDEEDGSEEVIAMVSATDTMTSQDMADCLSYFWMLSQYHFAGYTKIVSQYLYHIKNIDYREYYDRLYRALKYDPKSSEWVSIVEEVFISYLKNGEVPDSDKYNNVVALTMAESYKFSEIRENKDYFMDLGIEVAQELAEIPQSIKDLQHASVLDEGTEYPFTMESTIDIDRWTNDKVIYEIDKVPVVSKQHDQMYMKYIRRCTISNLTNPFVEKYVEDTYKGETINMPVTEVSNHERQF